MSCCMCSKLDDDSASLMRSHHLVSNTNYTVDSLIWIHNLQMHIMKIHLGCLMLVKCCEDGLEEVIKDTGQKKDKDTN